MAPFASPKSRLKDRLLTLRSLHLGHYYVDTNRVIDRMARRESRYPDVAFTYILPSETLAEARQVASNACENILSDIQSINVESESVTNAAINLADIAFHTKWRLGYNVAFSVVFGVISASAIVLKRKPLALVSGLAALISALSFLDELDIRSDELNYGFDNLRANCRDLATHLLELSTDHANHIFFVEAMKKRFGEAFTRGTDDPDELSEPYATSDGCSF